ncbi:MAG: Kae1-associated serine/threonine protein kinase [Methanomassiliicoccales archaeon]|nr:MAG: Kae1-associated serine/threonine protein kinase [Methanomassiliicoccales archaeon]
MLIRKGAEAEIRLEDWNGRKVVSKVRVRKGYRNTQLDERLRSQRIKTEVKLMTESRKLGISVPIIYDVDLAGNKIVMEFVEGERVKDVLESGYEDKPGLCRRIGEDVGKMHGEGIAHGDLTTSNILQKGDRLYFIDFSLGEKTKEVEVLGVDLHLLREGFFSAHSRIFELFEEVLDGYLASHEKGSEVVQKMNEIGSRGRYT